MGTWSHEAFGNDTACDWAYELEESVGFSAIDEALNEIIDMANDEFIDADIGAVAHAAVDAFARSFGPKSDEEEYPEPVLKWLDHIKNKTNHELIPKALQTLEILTGENSELDELWQESEEYDAWVKGIDELKEVLSSKV